MMTCVNSKINHQTKTDFSVPALISMGYALKSLFLLKEILSFKKKKKNSKSNVCLISFLQLNGWSVVCFKELLGKRIKEQATQSRLFNLECLVLGYNMLNLDNLKELPARACPIKSILSLSLSLSLSFTIYSLSLFESFHWTIFAVFLVSLFLFFMLLTSVAVV